MNNFIVIGTGFSGAVIAERIATQLNQKVLVIEQRDHIGGNCYDCFDENGFLIHKYGAHIFHTNCENVWNYISKFTKWRNYIHKVLVIVDNKKVPLPFNLNSIKKLFPKVKAEKIIESLLKNYPKGAKIPILELKNSKNKELQFLADFIYNKVFLNYTKKQWGKNPEDIAPNVTARVPIFISENDNYFQDKYQGIPVDGYTKLFNKILTHKNIEILLNTKMQKFIKLDFKNKKIIFNNKVFKGILIYTGMIDELFNYKFGKLPYRSLIFKNEYHNCESYQDVAVVNYPNDNKFTRIIEHKKLTGQKIKGTTISKEFPENFNGKNIPYYPLFDKKSIEKYKKYFEYSKQFKNLILIGRLAEYKYYDMDDAVRNSLETFEKIKNKLRYLFY